MKDYEPIMSFGEDVAKMYDDVQRGDENAAVTFLDRLAGGGPALELAVGTGRIALPLAARGIRVDGADISPAMVAQLRTKPGGDRISVTIGDFADVPVPGIYRLIYVVFNTLFNLLTQEEQVRCFENVAAHLTDDGSFVIEAGSPASSTGCVTTNTSMRSPSKSTRYGWMCFVTIRRSRCSTRATCLSLARAYT